MHELKQEMDISFMIQVTRSKKVLREININKGIMTAIILFPMFTVSLL